MTAISRAKDAINAIGDIAVSNAAALRIGVAFAPGTMTDEERAESFLAAMKGFVVEKLRSHAVGTSGPEVQTIYDTAKAVAEVDME